jgi:hypothetical protein
MEASATEGAVLVRPELKPDRDRSIDNLKVLLVAGVIVGHTTIAWTGIGTWVFDEPHLREPFLSIISLFLVAALFAMALFFFIAGIYTAPSLARKGPKKFVIDRVLRLGIPMLFFILLLSPVIEYVDPENAGWTEGFWAFTVDIWWPPAPGPTWFLGILLLFSILYACVRAIRPAQDRGGSQLRLWHLMVAAIAIAAASYAIRLMVPLGEELWRLALPQAPGWIAGFVLGVMAGERGWLFSLDPKVAVVVARSAWVALGAGLLLLAAAGFAIDPARLFGGPTWESALMVSVEAALVVTMPFWVIDLFRRRFSNQGPLLREMSRAAFAAFLIHQLILVGLVLASRYPALPPEVDYLVVSAAGVAVSFYLGWLLLRIPGISRIL